KRTPSSYLGSCRFKLPEIEADKSTYDKIFKILKELDIEYFFYIGGNDSMDTIKKLSDYAQIINSSIKFMGVPKTIDNDLAVTDHTPGYGSAAKFIAATMKEIIRDGLVYDYPTVTVVEIMGRNAGWLTAAAALAKSDDCEGVDLIYLPEKVFDIDHFMATVKKLLKNNKSLVIAISEGIKVADGRYVFELSDHVEFVDAFGHKQMSGSAKYLSNRIAADLGVKSRAIELSTLQRCAAHMTSRTDITEAFNVGGAAVKAAFEGESGKVVVLKRVSDDPYMCITETHDVHDIANVEKKVPLEWITDDDYVTNDLVHYIRPLIQAELSPIMVDGLPRHLNVNM
ncbi:MAG: diphosphate--fructose-6-phosphate 1-phosphotransferase, partial [Treponema sp.]|nr:diphosphate--fructose-6-phosphate 1-phosphotransferase [Treponema sp.]